MRIFPLVALAVAGCGPATETIRLSPTALEPTAQTTPIPLFSATLPRCPIEDVGLITSEPRDFMSASVAVDGLRSAARRLGGDAVVHVRFIKNGVLSGTVVRFTTSDCKE